MRFPLRTTAAAALLTVAACQDSTAPSSTGSRFSATATGALTGPITGQSYGVAAAAGGRPHEIDMADIDMSSATTHNYVSLRFINPGSAPIGRGTFPVSTPSVLRSTATGVFVASLYTTQIGVSGATYLVGSSGTVTIEAVSARRVKGRFDVRLEEFGGPTASLIRTVHLTGRFDGPVRVFDVCANCVGVDARLPHAVVRP